MESIFILQINKADRIFMQVPSEMFHMICIVAIIYIDVKTT